MSLWNELKRRNVIRVAVAYVVTAWLIIQVAETILPLYDVADSTIRMLVTVLVVLFVPAVILAWVFEWTPSGLKADVDVPHEPAVPGKHRNFDRIVIVVLAIAVTYFAVDEFVIETSKPLPADQAIAIIPFQDLGPEAGQAYLAGGVAEEIRSLVAKIPQLKVISRQSVAKALESTPAVAELGTMLNVGHVLDGSIQRSGDRIRISAQLIDTESDEPIWSQTYDRTLEDIFEIQDEIAERIVESLHVQLVGPIPRSGRTDPQALALFIEAKQTFFRSTIEGGWGGIADRMDDLLDAALEIDSEFVEALSWKGNVNWIRAQAGEISAEEARELALQIDEQVAHLDPDHFSLFANRAWMLTYDDVDFPGAAPLWEQVALRAPNNGEYLRYVGRFARYLGRYEISTQLHERAVDVDPLCATCLYHLSRNYMHSGQWDRAAEARERYLLLDGRGGYFHYGIIKLMQGDVEGAYQVFDGPRMDPATEAAGKAMALYALGQTEESDQMLVKLKDELGDRDPTLVAEVHAFRGENNQAFAWLDKLLAQPPRPLNGYVARIEATSSFLLHNLHDDPRWEQFRMSVGIPTELVESIPFSIDLDQHR